MKNMGKLFLNLCPIFIIFYSFYSMEKMGQQNIDPHAMDKTVETILEIKKICGELCDTSKKIIPDDFMGSVTSEVDCDAIFRSQVFHMEALLPPQHWENIPTD